MQTLVKTCACRLTNNLIQQTTVKELEIENRRLKNVTSKDGDLYDLQEELNRVSSMEIVNDPNQGIHFSKFELT